MKASELIQLLEARIAAAGDRHVYHCDSNGLGLFPVNVVSIQVPEATASADSYALAFRIE